MSTPLALPILIALAGAPEAPDEAAPAAPADEASEGRDVEARISALEAEVEALEARLKAKEEAHPDVVVRVHGSVDFGFFVPEGNGSGIVQDYQNTQFPQYAGRYSWVFLGDLLAPVVNSRGEVADLGDSPGVARFDSIHSRGAPGFILSEANLTLKVGLHHSAILTTSVNFVPRSGSDFALGDFFDLDLAQLEWVVADDPDVSIFVGKIEPVFGIEYRQRTARERFGITPSLAQRYTSGTQLGLKARVKLFGERLILAGAATNGSSTTEQFHFHDEIDSNAGKTVSGRVAIHLPLDGILGELGGTLEIGVSGEVGPQDRAHDNAGLFRLYGADLEYARSDLSLRAEVLRGRAPGSEGDGVFALDLRGTGYVEITWMVLERLGVLVRGDLRDAFITLGSERAYVTKSWRATGGVRGVISPNVVLKAEYLRNGEYGGIREIPNDIFTSSLLVTY